MMEMIGWIWLALLILAGLLVIAAGVNIRKEYDPRDDEERPNANNPNEDDWREDR